MSFDCLGHFFFKIADVGADVQMAELKESLLVVRGHRRDDECDAVGRDFDGAGIAVEGRGHIFAFVAVLAELSIEHGVLKEVFGINRLIVRSGSGFVKQTLGGGVVFGFDGLSCQRDGLVGRCFAASCEYKRQRDN